MIYGFMPDLILATKLKWLITVAGWTRISGHFFQGEDFFHGDLEIVGDL